MFELDQSGIAFLTVVLFVLGGAISLWIEARRSKGS